MSISNRPGSSRKPKRPRMPETPGAFVAQVSKLRFGPRASDPLRTAKRELMEEASHERVLLGGCTIFDGRPSLACLDCGRQWS